MRTEVMPKRQSVEAKVFLADGRVAWYRFCRHYDSQGWSRWDWEENISEGVPYDFREKTESLLAALNALDALGSALTPVGGILAHWST